MKTTSRTFSRISVAVFAAALFISTPVYAITGPNDDQSNDNKNRTSETNKQALFCKSFDSLVNKTSTEVNKRGGSSKNEWQKRAGNIDTKRSDWAAKVAAARAEAAKKRDANFAKLDALATTDEQKAAVAAYKTAVLAAVATRQTAYDANFAAYFQAVDALLGTQKTNSSGDVDAFKASVAAAVAKAQTSCTAGGSADSIKTQLSADLKAARDTFKGNRTGDKATIKAQLQALKNTRKEANKKATETFKATIQAARTELKTAFGEESV